jgi:hypothetical protein
LCKEVSQFVNDETLCWIANGNQPQEDQNVNDDEVSRVKAETEEFFDIY